MKIQIKNSMRGFAIMDLLVYIAIAAAIISVLVARFGVAGPESRASVINGHIGDIVTATRGWRGFNKPYTGISIKTLVDMGKLPDSWGTGVGANPAQGNYTVAAANPPARFVVTATNLDDKVCLNVQNLVMVGTYQGGSATCTNGTLSATFE